LELHCKTLPLTNVTTLLSSIIGLVWYPFRIYGLKLKQIQIWYQYHSLSKSAWLLNWASKFKKIAISNHILHLPLKLTNVTQNLVKSSKCSQNSTIDPELTKSTKHAYHLELPSKNTSIILKIDFRLKLQF
jgi:hypothetical protein